jgi:hypothetical protein
VTLAEKTFTEELRDIENRMEKMRRDRMLEYDQQQAKIQALFSENSEVKQKNAELSRSLRQKEQQVQDLEGEAMKYSAQIKML